MSIRCQPPTERSKIQPVSLHRGHSYITQIRNIFQGDYHFRKGHVSRVCITKVDSRGIFGVEGCKTSKEKPLKAIHLASKYRERPCYYVAQERHVQYRFP